MAVVAVGGGLILPTGGTGCQHTVVTMVADEELQLDSTWYPYHNSDTISPQQYLNTCCGVTLGTATTTTITN